MRPFLVLALLLASTMATAADPPPDAFCIVAILPGPDFQQVRIVVDEESDSPEKKEFWAAADQDGDGVLRPDEIEAFRDASLAHWSRGEGMANRSLALHLHEPYATTAPLRPIYATTWRQVGHGIPGIAAGHHPKDQVMGIERFETQALREYTFHVAGDPERATLLGGHDWGADTTWPTIEYHPRAVIEYVVVTAPPGWLVERVEGYGYEGRFETHHAAARVDVAGFDTGLPWQVHYVREASADGHDAPIGLLAAAALGLGLLGAVALGLLARRRP